METHPDFVVREGNIGGYVDEVSEVLWWGTTDPITGEVATWAGVIVTTYFGGRTIEKVARIFRR